MIGETLEQKIRRILNSPKFGMRQVSFCLNIFDIQVYDKDGNLKLEDEAVNIIPDVACTHLLDSTLGGGTQISTWYLGLTDSDPTPAAGDTMASHPGWTEVQTYAAATRPTWSSAAAANKSITNAASKASFAINGAANVGGLFLTSDNTKGGTAGMLYSVAAAQEGNRNLVDGDTLEATGTFNMVSA